MTHPAAVRRRVIPAALNLLLCLLLGGVQIAWLGGLHPEIAVPLMLLGTPAYWALIHESMHGSLLAPASANLFAGRLLAIGHGAPYAPLRLGHLLHHRYSRTLDASETYDPAQEPAWRARLRHYATIFGGLYAGEVLSGWISLLPLKWREGVARRLAGNNALTDRYLADQRRPGTLRETRLDTVLAALLYLAAVWCWRDAIGWFVLSLCLRALLVSFFDNAYHYGTPLGSEADEVRNHSLPKWAGGLVLNFHWHGVHHQHPNAAWITLPALARALGAKQQSGYFFGALQQLRGPRARERTPPLAAFSPDSPGNRGDEPQRSA